MAIGAVMGVDHGSLMEIGAGCVIHDVGMLRLAPDLLNCERPLDVIERLDITKHPSHTFDMIKDVAGLSVGTKMIAYQTHERLDGSGYPRKIRGPLIHYYSRIAMVADAFTAMTSPRPHRPAMLPHYAICEILDHASTGRFDADVIKGLLDTVSMFPLGSFVELNNGRVGTVVRANPGEYTRPIIELSPGGDSPEREVVNLKEQHDLKVVRPLFAI
jgi:HD-GYP domain-containing protein (c-di-GMP phosphodiesterase class II)